MKTVVFLAALFLATAHGLPVSNDDVPDAVDWREKDIIRGVWNEGGCNSSWAIATAELIESSYNKKYRRDPVLLTPQQLIDCVNDTDKVHGCAYGSIEPALDWLIHNDAGLMLDEDYLYSAFDFDICRYNESAKSVKIDGWYRVFPFSEDQLKHDVSLGPVAAGIHKLPSLKQHKSGIYYDPECSSDEKDHNHHVLIVGYGSEDGQDYWIVKESAGIWFGEGGFVRMARNRGNHCGIASAAFSVSIPFQ